jgi:hypothetical protein
VISRIEAEVLAYSLTLVQPRSLELLLSVYVYASFGKGYYFEEDLLSAFEVISISLDLSLLISPLDHPVRFYIVYSHPSAYDRILLDSIFSGTL